MSTILRPDELVRAIPFSRRDTMTNRLVIHLHCRPTIARTLPETMGLKSCSPVMEVMNCLEATLATPGRRSLTCTRRSQLMMRQRVIEPMLLHSRAARSVPGLKKIVRYVEQARLPMPERMESYNLLDHFGASTVFTSTFLNGVNISEPRNLQREIYQRNVAQSIVDSMLAYDWRFTLADNDLPKVRFTAHLAGTTVGFPFLDDDLVNFSLSLPASMKVHRLTLRHFFKTALQRFSSARNYSQEKTWLRAAVRTLANERPGTGTVRHRGA